jgi:hypothetical protein
MSASTVARKLRGWNASFGQSDRASKDGHAVFRRIVLNTIGLGNDPYEMARLRIQKNKLTTSTCSGA